MTNSILSIYKCIFAILIFNNFFTQSINFTFNNYCNHVINLYSHENNNYVNLCNIKKNKSYSKSYNNKNSGVFKHTLSPNATLFEYSIVNYGIYYDISIISTNTNYYNKYTNFNKMIDYQKNTGFNIPMQVKVKAPKIHNSKTCDNLFCNKNNCTDAYLYPEDDLKTHFCDKGTIFNINFCNKK